MKGGVQAVMLTSLLLQRRKYQPEGKDSHSAGGNQKSVTLQLQRRGHPGHRPRRAPDNRTEMFGALVGEGCVSRKA